jgi:hypothetical protein
MVRTVGFLVSIVAFVSAVTAQDVGRVGLTEKSGSVDIAIDGKSVAIYVPGDERTHRPYFKDVKTPSGIQVTRNHPPVKDQDADDHADMHPGIWMAYADLGGHDFWRNKGPRVVQEKLTVRDAGNFETANRYTDGEQTLARETVRYTIVPRPAGYLLVWDTTLEPLVDGLYFGDTEEMGLGVRVATPIAVKRGKGHITNSAGGANEKGTWGRIAQWCDYAGPLGGKHVGVAVMADPSNPTKTWFHSRDYGFFAANSFGQHAGAPSKIPLAKGKPVRMRFGVLVHEGADAKAVDLPAEFKAFAGGDNKTTPAPPEPQGMITLFDGKTLDNWDGDPRLWSVKDGVIHGETTKENPANGNTFMFWKGGTVKDFELRLSFRMNDTNNSGVQYRSKHLDPAGEKNKWVAKGYQAEVRVDAETPGFIYDERGTRKRMCLVGERGVWENGEKHVVGSVGDPAAIRAALKPDGWNDYVIIARGNHIQHFINGVQTIDFTDKDPQLALTEGVLALQLHAGKPMWVEFRDVRLKQY